VFSTLLGVLLVAGPAVMFFWTLTCSPAPVTCDELFCTPAHDCPSPVSALAVVAIGAVFLWPLARTVKSDAPRT